MDDGKVQLSLEELVSLGAVDTGVFAHSFFPKTYRQPDSPEHQRMWDLLDNPNHRFVSLQSFRGSSKTSRLRTFAAKRLAYGVSRTALYIGATENHALNSLTWLRSAIEKNDNFRHTFGLEPGTKWTEDEAQILRTTENETCWIKAFGIESKGLRGVNFEDWRPDLIVLDDVITDENASTADQRKKINDLIYGAIIPGLAPRIDAPNGKVVMLQTPINAEDAAALAQKDPMWVTHTFSCWSEETRNLPIELRRSAWEERFPTLDLQKLYLSYVSQNRLSVWMREYECQIISAEKTTFKPNWIQYWEGADPKGTTYVVIDPVPPPSEKQIANNLLGKDWECIMVVRRSGGRYYVLDYRTNQGHEPNWTVATALEFALRYNVLGIVVETVAYQKVLEYLLRQEMLKRGRYWALMPFESKQSKYMRITNVLTGPMSQGVVYLRQSMTSLASQINMYPGVAHDDEIDALSMGIMKLANVTLEDNSQAGGLLDLDESQYEDIPDTYFRRSP